MHFLKELPYDTKFRLRDASDINIVDEIWRHGIYEKNGVRISNGFTITDADETVHSLLEILEIRASKTPENIAYVFLEKDFSERFRKSALDAIDVFMKNQNQSVLHHE